MKIKATVHVEYNSFEMDDDEDPCDTLNGWAGKGWNLITATPFIDESHDDRGYSYKTRKIRYMLRLLAGHGD